MTFDNPDGGLIRCEECGVLLGYIVSSEWISQALCITCARKNNELDDADEVRIKDEIT